MTQGVGVPWLPLVVAGAILVSLNAYVLLAGADFGGGVWDLLSTGPRASRQRRLIADALAPVWEANHVWLILVVVLLFTAFPPAFARLMTVLHIPMSLMLVGIVLRGSAFMFRSYGSTSDESQQRWGRMFAIASIITPVLLGVTIGAIASGRVRATIGASVADTYLWSWLAPFPIGVGALALAVFAFLAAVYLAFEAKDEDLREDFRRRALAAAGAVFVVAFGDLALARSAAPALSESLMAGALALPLQAATGAAAVLAVWAMWNRSYRLARVAAAGQVTFILWGWVYSQFPYLVPPDVTISGAAAPPLTLELLLGALGLGLIALVPALRYLFRVFKSSS